MVKDIFSDFPSCKFSIITKYIIINEVTTETFTFTLANALNVIDGTSRVVMLPQISNNPLVNLERERKLQISASLQFI